MFCLHGYQLFVYNLILQKQDFPPKRRCFHEFLFWSFKIQFKFSTDNISIEDGFLKKKKMHSWNSIYTCYRVFFFQLVLFNGHFDAGMKLEVVWSKSLLKRNLCRINYPILAFQIVKNPIQAVVCTSTRKLHW